MMTDIAVEVPKSNEAGRWHDGGLSCPTLVDRVYREWCLIMFGSCPSDPQVFQIWYDTILKDHRVRRDPIFVEAWKAAS